MRRATLSFAVFAFAGAVMFAGSANAAVYTVTLNNGATFDTRYQPERASWDNDVVLLLSEWGNQIAFRSSDIQGVTVDTETRGFGHQLDGTTIAVGWAPNDAIDPDSDEGRAAAAAEQAAATAAANAPPVYNQQQFVEPGALTGLPVWMTGVDAVPQVQPQQPPSPN